MLISKYITKKALSSNKLKHCNNSLLSTKSTGRQTLSRSINSRFSILSNGFTIVELLVVIVVIGILAAITIVSYVGISTKANLASAQSDLANNTNLLKLYYTIYGSYPVLDGSNCPTAPSTVDNNYCLKVSSGNTLAYSIDHKLGGTVDYTNFGLSIKSSTGAYYTNNASDLKCPANFIPVPGSSTYGTKDFCVMKYNASQVGASNTPTSQSGNLPWVSISQTNAIAYAPNTKSIDGSTCTSCHLMTEPEYMTIAQNVLSVASNWDDGAGVHTVGTGYIYSGHNDNVPANALAANSNDSIGYASTGNSAPSSQRRTLTLSNGQVLWDFAGNVWEWTSGTIASGAQPGYIIDAGYVWRQWNDSSMLWNGLPANSQASSLNLSGSSGWTSSNGIGRIVSYYGETIVRGFLRGGDWSFGSDAGVLALTLSGAPNGTDTWVGFRVSR